MWESGRGRLRVSNWAWGVECGTLILRDGGGGLSGGLAVAVLARCAAGCVGLALAAVAAVAHCALVQQQIRFRST